MERENRIEGILTHFERQYHQIKDQVPDSAEIRSIVEFLNATELGIIGKM